MRELLLLSPELILTGAALAMIMASRHIHHARLAAGGVIVAAIAACYSGFVIPWEGPRVGFGGTITADGYAQFFSVVFAANLVVAALLAVRHLEGEHVRPGEYYALLLLATTGMMLTAASSEFLVLYLGIELMTLCSYVLVGITRDKPTSNEAAIKYFLLGSFASVVLLYGISLAYGVTGTTDFGAISAAVSGRDLGHHPLLRLAVALIIGGLAFKVAAVPFHSWAPDAYQGASAPVAAFLAAGSKAAGLAALGRVCLMAFGTEPQIWSQIIMVLAALSIAVGALLALTQTDMKRMLAYSSISHAGYALLGLVAGTAAGVSATMMYSFIYAFMTLGAFGVVVGLGERGETIDRYRGLAASSPWAAGLMFLFLLSLTGIPPTAGFAAKFSVILSIIRSGHVLLAVLAVLCSVISAFFYLRIAVLMYMTDSQETGFLRLPAAVSVALVLAAVVTIFGGLFPGTVSSWAARP